MPRASAVKKDPPPLPAATNNRDADAAAAQQEQVGQPPERVMKSTGPAKKSLDAPTTVTAETVVNTEWAEMMQFNQDMLTVQVHDTTEKHAERIIQFWVNGELQNFPRGKTVTCKRYFVDKLARCKPTTFTQDKRRDEDGNEHMLEVPHNALRYPFTVINDPHPRGREWLEAILKEVN